MHLVACHDCDLLNRFPETTSATMLCARCGAVLHHHRPDSINRALSLTLAAFILFVIANCFPFLAMKSGSFVQETTLMTGIHELWKQGMYSLALLVLLTCLLIPLFQITGVVYVLLPLTRSRQAPGAIAVLRLLRHLAPWGMMEIFMIGILVALVKLGKMATVIPGISAFAFGVLIFVMAAAITSLDFQLLWQRYDLRR